METELLPQKTFSNTSKISDGDKRLEKHLPKRKQGGPTDNSSALKYSDEPRYPLKIDCSLSPFVLRRRGSVASDVDGNVNHLSPHHDLKHRFPKYKSLLSPPPTPPSVGNMSWTIIKT